MELPVESAPVTMTEEEFQLLNIFPEEVWLLIFDKLMPKDPKKAYKMYNKSLPFFQKLISPNINKIVFPIMLRIMHNWFRKHTLRQANFVLLPFRKICKDWRNDVDSLSKRGLHTTHFTNELNFDLRTRSTEFMYEFATVQNFQEFQQHFDATHLASPKINPFVTSAVRFHFLDADVNPEEMQDALTECLQMLAKYGAFVNTFVLNMEYTTRRRCLSFIRQTLALMPNLKSLTIWVHYSPIRHPNRNPIGQNLVPCIPKLEKLQFLEIEKAPCWLAKELLLQNGHVPKVAANVCDETENLPYLHGVQELSINVNKISLSIPMPSGSYPQFKWQQLRKLEFCERREDIRLGALFFFLEYHFANTLEELRLFVPDTITEETPVGMLMLKKLQVLKLHLPKQWRIPGKICSLRFLQPMQNSLRELLVWRDLESKNHDIDKDECFHFEFENDFKFFSVRWDLPKSNMWTKFPQLQRLGYFCDGKGKIWAKRQQ